MTKEKTINHTRTGLKVILLFGLIAIVFLSVLISINKDVTINWESFNPQVLMEQLHTVEAEEKAVLSVLKTLMLSILLNTKAIYLCLLTATYGCRVLMEKSYGIILMI